MGSIEMGCEDYLRRLAAKVNLDLNGTIEACYKNEWQYQDGMKETIYYFKCDDVYYSAIVHGDDSFHIEKTVMKHSEELAIAAVVKYCAKKGIDFNPADVTRTDESQERYYIHKGNVGRLNPEFAIFTDNSAHRAVFNLEYVNGEYQVHSPY